MKSYTQNHWSVSSLVKDTCQTAKALQVPDLTYKSDYKKTLDEPTESKVTNVTSSEIGTVETVRFGMSQVQNVYKGTGVDISMMPVTKQGVQVMVELTEKYRAVHETTGQEIDLPCKGRLVLRFPTNTCVSEELVKDLLLRTVAACLNTGSSDATRLIELARGSLLPSGL